MKKIFIILISLLFYNGVHGQVFYGATGTVLDNGGQESQFDCGVSGLSNLDSLFGIVEVTIDITHPAVEEIDVSLISPWGTNIDLTGVLSLKGTNLTGTTFRSDVHNSITLGTAPFTGTFRPVGYLGRFNSGKSGNGTWKLAVKDFVLGNVGTVNSWSIKFASNPPKPVVLHSSNLPIVFIETGGGPVNEQEVVMNFGIVDNHGSRNFVTDPRNGFNGKASIHLRGSSSKMFEKKNMKVELRDQSGANDLEVPLLGMSIDHDWILTAFYNDKSLMRNALTHHLYRQMGRYSPRFRYVELVINGEYYGIYLLMEQIKRGDERVKIQKITDMDNNFPNITGGYIVQINRTDDPGWLSKYPGVSSNNAKFYYQYNYPKAENITEPQKQYIRAVLDSLETVMDSPGFADWNTGYRKFIDVASFVDYLIINEFSKNVDAYKLSTYLYKDNVIDGGKLHIGPPWDYDLAWNNANFADAGNEKWWQYDQENNFNPSPTWWRKLVSDPAFKDHLFCRYHSLRGYALSDDQIYAFIDEMKGYLHEAQQRNFKQFPLLGTYIYGNPQNQTNATFDGEVGQLKEFIGRRGKWLDENVPGYCDNVSVSEIGAEAFGIRFFPNPVSDRLQVTYRLSDACKNVRITLFDIRGAEVQPAVQGATTAGEHQQLLDCRDLAAGTYLMEVNVDGQRFYNKLVKIQ